MVMLLIASFWTWAIIFEKSMRLRRLRSQAKQFEEAFWSGGSLELLFDRLEAKAPDPMSALFVTAMREWRRSAAKGLTQTDHMKASLQERIERVMDITLGREMDQSRAPHDLSRLGRFGGTLRRPLRHGLGHHEQLRLHRRFEEHDVGGGGSGIAQALFATALGLVAAIPAVLAYNKLSGSIGRFGNRLEAFCGEFGAILSRQLEEKR